jgi:hypothetical protein
MIGQSFSRERVEFDKKICPERNNEPGLSDLDLFGFRPTKMDPRICPHWASLAVEAEHGERLRSGLRD